MNDDQICVGLSESLTHVILLWYNTILPVEIIRLNFLGLQLD